MLVPALCEAPTKRRCTKRIFQYRCLLASATEARVTPKRHARSSAVIERSGMDGFGSCLSRDMGFVPAKFAIEFHIDFMSYPCCIGFLSKGTLNNRRQRVLGRAVDDCEKPEPTLVASESINMSASLFLPFRSFCLWRSFTVALTPPPHRPS